MKKYFNGLLICVLLLSSPVLADTFTSISYSITDTGSGQWEYTYDVQNTDLAAGIEQFTIYFDYGLYENLTVTSPTTPGPQFYEIVDPLTFETIDQGNTVPEPATLLLADLGTIILKLNNRLQ